MTMTTEQKAIYDLVLENHFANVQILKNQKCLLQELVDVPNTTTQPAQLLEQTDNILRLVTHGKESG